MPEWPENNTPISAMSEAISYYDREIKKAEDRLSELLDWVEKKRQELGGLRSQRALWIAAKNTLVVPVAEVVETPTRVGWADDDPFAP